MTSEKPIRVLVAGLGNMGRSHALAYHNNPGFEIVGLVNRSRPSCSTGTCTATTIHPDFLTALAELKPDLCSINTYSDSHADYAVDGLRGRLRRVRRKAAGNDGCRCGARRCRRQGAPARSW